MGDHQTVEYDVNGHVATIWLNRPEKRNALNRALFDELADAAARAEADPEVRAVLLRGRGKTFCAGGDLSMVRDEGTTVPTSLSVAKRAARTFAAFYEMGKPTVAVVHGHAVAGGFELMISTDFVVSTTDARIGDFHITRALFGGGGPIYRLPRLVGMRRAKELVLTGRTLSGVEAERINLVNAVAAPEDLDAAVKDFVAPLVALSPIAMSITKMALNRGLDGDTQTLMTMEHLACSLLHQTDDCREGIEAFLDRRDPVWLGT